MIQPISTDNKVLTRSMATTKSSDKDKVRDENERTTKWLAQKDSSDSDSEYLKILVKEIQKALKTTLKEKQQLSEDLQEVKLQNEILIEEKQHLSKLAEEGIKLRDLLNEYP